MGCEARFPVKLGFLAINVFTVRRDTVTFRAVWYTPDQTLPLTSRDRRGAKPTTGSTHARYATLWRRAAEPEEVRGRLNILKRSTINQMTYPREL